MESTIIPLSSTSHARPLARVRTTAFQTGHILRSIFSADQNPRLVEDWLVARETVALQDAKQQTLAVVREVGDEEEEEEEDEDGVASYITIPPLDVDGSDAARKRYVILAFADWMRLPGQDAERCKGDEAEAEATQQKRGLLFGSDYLPEGTNLVLNSAFRTKMEETRKKYVDEEKDCGMLNCSQVPRIAQYLFFFSFDAPGSTAVFCVSHLLFFRPLSVAAGAWYEPPNLSDAAPYQSSTYSAQTPVTNAKAMESDSWNTV